MSILLEALKQKNSQSASSRLTASKKYSESRQEDAAPELPFKMESQLDSIAEPMETLVSMLAIEPPSGLNWQLTSAPDRGNVEPSTEATETQPPVSPVKTSAPSLAPLSFDLILPTAIPPKEVQKNEQLEQILTPTLEISKPEASLGQLNEITSLSVGSFSSDDTEIRDREMQDALNTPIQEPIAEERLQSDTGLNVKTVEAFPERDNTESSLNPIRLPTIEKTPLSAQRFLSFARRLKPNQAQANDQATTEVKLTPKPHKSNAHQVRQPLLVVGGIVVGVSVLSYAALSVWESQQASHLQQMARYKNQSLTELPERPLVNTQLSEQLVDLQPVEISTKTEPVTAVSALSEPPVAQQAIVDKAPNLVNAKPVKLTKDGTSFNVLDTTRLSKTNTSHEVMILQSQPISEWLSIAYQAYDKGDWQQAESYYRQVLEKKPNQRDALLGMLAIYQLDASRIGDAVELAEHLRRLYPNDKEVRLATDGLGSSLLSERLSESELKQTQQLVTQPSEASFRLGLLLADQQRWPEAHSAFFDAVKAAPNNPSYRLNLAISYDHLGKHRLAVEHYQQLMSQGKAKLIGLDVEIIQQRLDFLLPLLYQEP
ncbi:MAG: tetratricopeptide repeat protein [Thiotrichales bacterium]|nr:MAG: tetratricopeptide repeat protein [Thiotrichales bacterium]